MNVSILMKYIYMKLTNIFQYFIDSLLDERHTNAISLIQIHIYLSPTIILLA